MNVIRAGSYGALLGITAFAIISAGCAAVEEVGRASKKSAMRSKMRRATRDAERSIDVPQAPQHSDIRQQATIPAAR